MKMSGEFSMAWKDERTNEHGIVESTNMIVNGGIDKLIDALLKEAFQFGPSTDGSIPQRTVDYATSGAQKYHIGQIRLGTSPTAPAETQTNLLGDPALPSNAKSLYSGTNLARGVTITPITPPATGRGFTIQVAWGSTDANPSTGSVTYQEAGLFMGEGPSFSDMFARTVFPAIAKNRSRSMTSKWTIRWT